MASSKVTHRTHGTLTPPSGLLQPKRRHSMPLIPPTWSEVRIVLLGENVSLTNTVGNFILGRSAFETKDLSSEKLQSDRASGQVEGRIITIINTPHLYNPQLSQEELSQRVEECISLADPGPHVFLLVLQSDTVTHQQHDGVRSILETYSPLSRERSIVITTAEDHGFINECEVRHHRIQNISTFNKHQVLQLLGKIDAVVKETGRCDLQEKRQSGTQNDQLTISTAKTDDVWDKLEKNKMSDLRIILLGKSPSDTSSVGNTILGRPALETEHPLYPVDLHCERVRGHVMGRNITIINVPPLFHQALTHHQLTQCIKECVSLSAPGPHVIMLIVQLGNFTEDDKRRMEKIFSSLSEETHKYTMVVTTKNIEIGTSVDQVMKVIQEIIAECNNRYLEFSGCSQASLVGKIEELVTMNKGSLNCEIFEDANPAVLQKWSEQIGGQLEQEEKLKEYCQTTTTKTDFSKPAWDKVKGVIRDVTQSEQKQTPHLKLVLVGMEAVKASISKLLLGKSPSLVQTLTGLCVKKGEVCGHLITLVEMPAFYNTQLSEHEVMRQTLHCVSVCHPGVHVFFIIIPEDPLTDEEKAEIKLFQRIFSSRVNDHTIFIINQQSQREELNETLQAVIKPCGGRYIFYSSTTDADQLITHVKNLLKQNSSRQYTMVMYCEAQIETQLQYKEEINKRNKNKDLLKNPDTLRIVLLGKTGVGKSASGNTILGKKKYKELMSAQSVTSVCQKVTGEVSGREITVIDTPGLFDTNIDNDETKKEIIRCISMAAPGPHVFLLVLKVGRFTQEEKDAVEIIEKTFGEKSNMYTIVLFTGGDTLKGQTIEQYIESAGTWLQRLLLQFGNRYHVFNNNDKSSKKQVLSLLQKIDSMVKVNGGSCYTNQMFQQIEKTLEEEKERILKEREEQIETEKEKLKAKHEDEMKKMRKEMQEEKERQDVERRRKEEEFKQKEEQIKREMSEKEQQVREDFRKRREEDDLTMKEWMEEINREREENRKQCERQQEEDQKWRDQEEEERRRREGEWKKQQREEKEKFNREKEEMKKNKEEDLKKLQKEYEQKSAEEEKRRRDLHQKIKDAEETKKKELQDLQFSQQQEWERKMKKEKEMREKQQKIWEGKMAAMEEKWNLDQIRREKQYEWERQKEKEKRDQEEKYEEERRRIMENEANEKIRKMEEQINAQREKAERERNDKDEEHRKEMEEKLQTQREEFRKEKEDEERKRNDEEKKYLAFIEEQHKKEQENLKRETEQAARKQAEEEFTTELDKKVKEAKAAGIIEGCEIVESERTELGRVLDQCINYFCKNEEKTKDELTFHASFT